MNYDIGEYERQFYHFNEAWYAPANRLPDNVVDEVNFGLYHHDGGCAGEMAVRWHRLGGSDEPRLECYDDAWRVLALFNDVVQEMAKVGNQGIAPAQFCELLARCGFKDCTSRENPTEITPQAATKTPS